MKLFVIDKYDILILFWNNVRIGIGRDPSWGKILQENINITKGSWRCQTTESNNLLMIYINGRGGASNGPVLVLGGICSCALCLKTKFYFIRKVLPCLYHFNDKVRCGTFIPLRYRDEAFQWYINWI